MSRIDMLIGMAAGAGLMYVLDPERGRKRRALLRDQLVHGGHVLAEDAAAGSRDLWNRTKGMFAEARHVMDGRHPDDVVLEERVRAALGRVVRHPGSIEVHAEDGMVTVRGPVLSEDAQRLFERVSRVRGVRDVIDELDVYEDPADIPGLQGRGILPQERRAGGWRPATRLLVGLAGGGLALWGLCMRGAFGLLSAVAGAALLTRALTNWETKRLLGMTGRRSVDLTKTVNIDAPVDRVFELWSDYENFPKFMSHVRHVRQTGERRSQWTVGGPFGAPVEWDAVITGYEPNQMLAWRTEPGSLVQHAGIVRFEPNPDGTTRVTVRFSYNPGAGVIGHVVAALFHTDPKVQMDDDLMRMKTFIETGELPTDAHESGPRTRRREGRAPARTRHRRGERESAGPQGAMGETGGEEFGEERNAAEARDRGAEAETTAFTQNPDSIPAD